MNAIQLLQIGFNALVFFATIYIGRRNPRIPLIAMVWAAPYIAGNFIFGLYLPFAPVRALGFGIAVLAVTNRRPIPVDLRLLLKRVYLYLGICLALALVGICLVYLRAGYIDQWRQAPWVRVLNATGAEVLRWLLLIAPIMLAAREKLSRKLIRHAILAGLFYCALGFVQFGMEQAISYDPFPIVREGNADSGPSAQSAMARGLDDRINSICGEPRYLAAYSCLWFLLTGALGKRVGFSASGRLFIEGIFLVTLVLTGSRTGPMMLVGAWLIAGVVALFSGARRQALQILAAGLLLGGCFGALIVLQMGSFGSRIGNANPNLSEEDTSVNVGGIPVPIEFQDAAALMVMMQNPWQLLAGAGPGLWQYYMNPWEFAFVNRVFSGAAATGLDSVKPNLQLITRLSDVGLVGMGAMVAVFAALYRYGKARAPAALKKEYLLCFAMLVALLQFSGFADLLTFLMMGAAVQAYGEPCVADETKKRRVTWANKTRALPPSGGGAA